MAKNTGITKNYAPQPDGRFYCDYSNINGSPCQFKSDSRRGLGCHLRHHLKFGHARSTSVARTAKATRYAQVGDKWQCMVCHKEFDSMKQCIAHLGIHTKHNVTPKKCEICGKVVNSGSGIIMHMRMHEKRGDSGHPLVASGTTIKNNDKGDGMLPMALEIDDGDQGHFIEIPLVIKVRISVERAQ